MSRILADAAERPEVFCWNGPLDRQWLHAWCVEHNISVSEQLIDFWARTGGGEIFETETILSPSGDPSMGDDVLSVTDLMRLSGVSSEWVAFHVGLGTSACSTVDHAIAVFGPGGALVARFDNLEEWYEHYLRREYGTRYGLPA